MKKLATALGLACLAGIASSAHAAGGSQSDPVLPSFITANWTTASGQAPTHTSDTFHFNNPSSGLWFDPPPVSGFTISLSGGVFTQVTAPAGFSGLTLSINGQVLDSQFDAGEQFTFAEGVNTFGISGISPLLDPESTGFGKAFPLLLSFITTVSGINPSEMTWTTLSAVPEADVYAMLLLGLVVLGASKRRTAK